MKRFGLFFLSMLLSAFFLTSCLEGGSVTEGTFVCVLDYGKNFNPVLRSSSGYYSAPNYLNSLISAGDMNLYNCYLVYCRIDDKLPENTPSAIEMNGYTTVTILGYGEIPKYGLKPFLTDISTILEKEMPIEKALYENYAECLSDYLFMSHLVNHANGLELNWDISYDPSTMPTVENSKRYYDLYIRATVRKETEQTSKSNITHLTAYNMGSYLRNVASLEQSYLGSSYSASSSTFTLRVHYVTALDVAENSITWKNETLDIQISPFLEY